MIQEANYQQNPVVGTIRNDVKQLEADSLQLCLNLKNLQKNRAQLTNEVVALVQQLEKPAIENKHHDETMNLETDCIRVLLDAKHAQIDCCTICTCSECDVSEAVGDIERNDLEESLRKKLFTEVAKSQDYCCMCIKKSSAIPGLIEKIGPSSKVIDVKCSEKLSFGSTCSIEEESCDSRCETCNIELNDDNQTFDDSLRTSSKGDERCRGGMDEVQSKFQTSSIDSEIKNARKKRFNEDCECSLCGLRKAEGRSPSSLVISKSSGRLCDVNQKDEVANVVVSAGDAPAELMQICKVERLRQVVDKLKHRNETLRKMVKDFDCFDKSEVDDLILEKSKNQLKTNPEDLSEVPTTASVTDLIATVNILQSKCRTKDEMIFELANEVKNFATPDQTDRILKKLTNLSSSDSPLKDLDRLQLWRYLRMKNSQEKLQRDERPLDIVGQDTNDKSNPNEGCECSTCTKISPPRDLKIVDRIGVDTLVISWKPPESGSVISYKIFVDEQVIAQLTTPLRTTEIMLRNLDLTSPRLIEILAVDSSGLASSTIEKLFSPVRFEWLKSFQKSSVFE